MQPQSNSDVFQEYHQNQRILVSTKKNLRAFLILGLVIDFIIAEIAIGFVDAVAAYDTSAMVVSIVAKMYMPFAILVISPSIVGSIMVQKQKRRVRKLHSPEAKKLIRLGWLTIFVNELATVIAIAGLIIMMSLLNKS